MQSSLSAAKKSIAVVLRGGCSFSKKALVAQAHGFAGLVIIDASGNDPMPPGLGSESNEIGIPVVMTSDSQALSIFMDGSLREVVIKLTEPNETDLWLTSPWYNDVNGSLSASPPSSLRFSITCTKDDVHLIGDDSWLFRRWLEQLEAESGCHTVASIEPRTSISRASVDPVVMGELEATMSAAETPGGVQHGLVRLPHLDSEAEPMPRLKVLLVSACSELHFIVHL
jgi:hypothetical protein